MMWRHRDVVCRVWAGAWFALLLLAVPSRAGDAEAASAVPESEVRGRVICLAEAMHERFGADLPTEHDHVWGVATEDGQHFLLLRTRLSVALFSDARLRQRPLLLKGKVYPGTRILDATRFWSVKDGKVHDLYYWCEVCVIKSVVPGPCMCCQELMELVEELGE